MLGLSSSKAVVSAVSETIGSIAFGILVCGAPIQKHDRRTTELLMADVSIATAAKNDHCAVAKEMNTPAVGN